ncbi:MAG: 50S ribosomal protein L10 [Patescibacteria group bacterium]
MPVTRQQKEAMLAELNKLLEGSKSVFFADYRGIPVKSIQKLRRELRSKDVHFGVSKKTLIRLAAAKIGYDSIPESVLEGPVAVAISMGDPLIAAKIINTYTKEIPQLRLLGGLFDKHVLNAAEAKQYALLPGREELLAKLVYMLKSPIQGLHGTLSNTLAGFVRTVDAYQKKRVTSDV